jgi:hypothetical protein
MAAIAILYESIRKWIAGLKLEHLGAGALLILIAGLVNAGLGYYLVRTGRRTNSLILEADGKHVLTDSWTSFGVVGGLGLVLLTHWKPFDPLVAVAVAVNILWSGGRLVWHSVVGLMDYSDPKAGRKIRDKLDALCSELSVQYHGVRFRTTGYRQIIEVHLLFPRLTSVSEAHRLGQRFWKNACRPTWGCPPRSSLTWSVWKTMPRFTTNNTTPENRDRLRPVPGNRVNRCRLRTALFYAVIRDSNATRLGITSVEPLCWMRRCFLKPAKSRLTVSRDEPIICPISS